jgi:hypothetical protein
MAARAAASADPLGVVSRLVDTGTVDTVYRDVYLQRARTVLAGVLPVEEFRRIEGEKAELGLDPRAFRLVGISRDYDSDRVMARFAVVRRERMVAW